MPGLGSDPACETIHASCVALRGRAVLILGASGAGKSTLALQCIGLGATLVADDSTILTIAGDKVIAEAPTSISGMIEARGVGLLAAEVVDSVPVALIVDLDQIETERLPPMREKVVLGLSVPLVLKVDAPHFPAAILQFLRHGRRA